MNNLSSNESYPISELVMALDQVNGIVTNYASRGISIVGILVNLFNLLVLWKIRLDKKFYDCLFCRCLSNLVVCLLGSLHNEQHCMRCLGDYKVIILQVYIYYPLSRISLMASIFCDVLLILNRFLLLFNKRKNVCFTLSKKVS